MGFREPTVKDFDNIANWLIENLLTYDHDFEHLREETYRRFREFNIEPVTPDRIEQLIKSAIRTYEDRFFDTIYKGIPQKSLCKIDELIDSVTAISDLDEENTNSDSLSF